jgi:thiosulfate reductase cytochrome b subunit
MLVIVPIQFLTGLALWDVMRFGEFVEMVGSLRMVEVIHVLIYIFFVFFMFTHVYLVTLGKTKTTHIKEMITGYVEEDH